MSAPDWDARYAEAPAEGLFGDAPVLGLVMTLARLRAAGRAPRTAFLPADGDGRNSRFLAAEGLAVTASDLSAEAVALAARRDAAAGLAVARRAEDVADPALAPPPAVDLAALIFLQGPPALRRAGLARAAAALAPGGALHLEGFAGTPEGPGPRSPAQRWSLPETLAWLAEDAPDLAPEEAMEGLVRLDEGAKHQGPARLLRLLLIRPERP